MLKLVKANKVATLVFGLALVFSFIKVVTNTLKERDRNSHVNELIYPAFRKIEDYCQGYVFEEYVSQSELKRCEAVIEKKRRCDATDPTFTCSAEEYYDFLLNLGFDLPPFYEPGYSP